MDRPPRNRRAPHESFFRRLALPTLLISLVGAPAAFAQGSDADLEAAAKLFHQNLDAIRQRDREAYLACYRQEDALVRNGFGGVQLGYEELEASTTDETWPDEFEARDLQLFPISDGVVYGCYRYRVRYGEQWQEGLSERVFLRAPSGWCIAVTTAFGAPPGALPALPGNQD